MGVQNPNSTGYVHPNEPNLLNVHKAMTYDASGEPHLRVTLGSDNITVSGNVNLLDAVRVNNTEAQRIPVYIVGNTIAVTQGTTPWHTNANIIGNIAGITSLPAITGNIWINGITGNISGITTLPAITGNVGVVGNVQVTQGTTPWTVTGNVNASLAGQEVAVILAGASKETAFGELYGITITPIIQLDSIYGITSDVIDTFLFGTGATANANIGIYSVESGTSSTGYATLSSKRFLRYRPGQGALARFTAGFSPNVALTNQRAGLFNRESALQVGIHDDGTGPRFGVIRASGGKTHVTVLTINTAPTGAQTATVTLNGVAYTITGITSGTTTATAVQIATVGVFTGWFVDQVDNTIVFSSLYTGPATGAFSFSATGTGTLATGTFSTKQVGVVQTENWTYQEDFSEDTLDGNGPSGMTLHSEYLNVYQINFRWLGAGEIRYAIEDHTTGRMILFHKEQYTNRHTLPHISQPSFRLGYISNNVGSTTPAKVYGASMMGAIEGDVRQNELNRSTSVNKTGLAQNTVHHLLTLRNPYVTNGKSGAQNGNYVFNAKEIILKDVTIATQGTDPAVLYVFFNAGSFSDVHTYLGQPKDNGMVSTVDGTMDPTIDTAIARFTTAINGQASYPMRDFRVTIPPGSSISFAIASTNGISRCTFAVVFSED